MTLLGWMQLAVYVAILLAVTKPMGLYLLRVLDPDRAGGGPLLEKPFGFVERLIYRILGVRPKHEQSWKGYAIAMLMFSGVTMLVTYVLLRLQDKLPLNPQKLAAVGDHLAIDTAASFTTNTNWQNYGGESTMSYLSQMVALASHNFFSAAVGIATAAALVRGLTRVKSATIGNFWVDLVRLHLYVLLPICLVYAVILVSQGMIQNFQPYTTANIVDQSQAASTTQPSQQTIVQGPMASQMAIKMLGTNGGGYTNANAAHPYENPTPLSNLVQILSIFLIPSGLTYYLGRMVKNQSHGWSVFAAMFMLFLGGVLVLWWSETAGNPRVGDVGVQMSSSAMEGKEVRFGIFNSALFATITTDASCGAVNCMHDSLTPLGGLVPIFNIETGEVIFGGVGAGLYGMMIFIILAIFIAGLMVGRTPEYLGKKIEGFDVKCAVLAIAAPSLAIIGFLAWAAVADWGQAGTNNGGPHGFSEILYAYTSCAGNNGSAFAGLNAEPSNNDSHYDLTLASDMLVGRFLMMIPLLAMAGHMAGKKSAPQGVGSFPVHGPTFAVLLTGTVVIIGALTFLPALAMGPIIEHFMMWGSHVTY
jgi:potassium-transporting ATPase potassium-binding subunit